MSKVADAVAKIVKKTYKYFNLDTFETVEVVKEIPPYVQKTSDEVLALVAADNTILTKAVNAHLKRAGLRKIKLEVAALGGDTAYVSAMAKPFRAMPPWSQMYELDTNGEVKVDENGDKVVDRKAQTASIYSFIKSNPALVASIKQATLDAAANDEDGDETTETTEE